MNILENQNFETGLKRLTTKKLFVAFLTALLAVSFCFASNVPAQSKEIKCALDIKGRAIDVKLDFPANSFDKARLNLTDWGGQSNYAENIYRLSFTDQNGVDLPFEKIGERVWEVRNTHQAFELTYTVIAQKESFMGNNWRNHFHPALFENYVFSLANSFLFFPEAAAISALPVVLEMNGNEYGTVHSNFKSKADAFDDLRELFIAAGDYRVFEKRAGGRSIKFLLQGKNWKFSDADFVLGAKALPIEDTLKNSAVNVSRKPREVFELGFTMENGRLERGAKIKQVYASSAAETAGIKAGDELNAMNFTDGKPLEEAEITVIRENRSLQIKFFPKKIIELLQIDKNATLPK